MPSGIGIGLTSMEKSVSFSSFSPSLAARASWPDLLQTIIRSGLLEGNICTNFPFSRTIHNCDSSEPLFSVMPTACPALL